MEFDDRDTIIMKLLHYFITDRGYSPVVVHGIQNEIWLENMKEEYEIVRINSNYIHNLEQFNFDQFKTSRICKSIKKKVLLMSKLNILNIYTNLGDNASLSDSKHMTNLVVNNVGDFDNLDRLNNVFPNIKEKLKFKEDGMELYLKISKDIGDKNVKDMEMAKEVFDNKKPIITYILIALNILIYVIPILLGTYNQVINDYCLYGPYIRRGEYFRLLSSMFLHADLFHIAFNMYALYVLGSKVESLIGRFRYLIIYLLSGIIGGLLSMSLSNYASIGASGAIFGLMGALLYFGYHYRLYLGESLKSQIIPLIIINLIYGFIIPGVDNIGHIGGLIGGLMITSAVGIKYKESKSEQINGIVISAIFIGFLIYLGFVLKG